METVDHRLKIQKGDLLKMAWKGEFDIIVQGCNCFCTMGSGIARQIRERWPEVYAVDCKQTIAGDYMKLGNYTLEHVENGHLIVVNAYTQYDFNRSGETKDVFEYVSFQLILQKLEHEYGSRALKWGFPMIGMGLAGGDKNWIMGHLDGFSRKIGARGGSVTMVEYQP